MDYLNINELREHVGEADEYTVTIFAEGWTSPDSLTVSDVDQVLIACESFLGEMERFTDNVEIIVYAGDVLVRADSGEVIGADGYPECRVVHNEDGWTVTGA